MKYGASGMSSNPTTLTSPGISRPASCIRPQHPERHLVVGGEDRRDSLGLAAETATERRSRRWRSSPRPAAAADLGAGLLAASGASLDPLVRLEPVGGPGDVPDRLVAEVEQVRGGADGAGELIDGDDGDHVLGTGLDGDQRDVVRRVLQARHRVLLRRDHEDPVDTVEAQPLDRLGDRLAVERSRLATMMK